MRLILAAALSLTPFMAAAQEDTPEQMALLASGVGAVAVVAGLLVSLWLDLPAGPAMVACGSPRLWTS